MLCGHCKELQQDVIPILKRELPEGVHLRQIMKYVDDIKEYTARIESQSPHQNQTAAYTDDQLEDVLVQLFFDDYSLLRPAPEMTC